MLYRTSAFSTAARNVGRGVPIGSFTSCVFGDQRRFLEYWCLGVSSRTQPYAQGDMLPRLNNTRDAVNKSTAAAASLTGNHCGIAYDSSNIFSVTGYSPLEKEHYQPLRGINKHKIEPLAEKEASAAAALMQELMEEPDMEDSLHYLWWSRLLKDFPSLKMLCTPVFRKAWESFYLQVLKVAHDNAAVIALSTPFVQDQMQTNYISYAMIWRIAERLGDALEQAPKVSRYGKRASRMAVERVTKLMLDTIADEPWANQDATSPLLVDISNFRAWHEAGNW